MNATKRIIRCVVAPIVCIMMFSGCLCSNKYIFIHEPRPQEHADFDDYPLDFKVGDCFSLCCPVFLLKEQVDGKWWALNLDFREASSSKIEDFSSNPWKYPSIVRVVPAGEIVEIMSLKATTYHRVLLVYLRLQNGEEWVWSSMFEGTRGHYNRDMFRKQSSDKEGDNSPEGNENTCR